MRALLHRFDLRVSVAYGLVATLWIVLSDLILGKLFADNPPALTALSTVKGLVYVLVTTLGLFIVLRAELRKHHQLETALQQDIIERQRMEVALRESEQRFRSIADTAPAMLWMTAPDNEVTYLSRGWHKFTGQTEAEALGWGWLDAVQPEYRDEIKTTFQQASEAQVPFQVEYRLCYQADQNYRWAITTGTPRYSESGVFQGYIGSVVDVTEHKKVQQDLQEAERQRLELEADKELLELKERFISVVSHEFRTPLAVIIASAELLDRYSDKIPPERQKEHIHEVLSQAEFMVGLLEDVLTVNKARAGRLEFKPAPLDLIAFCQATLERVQGVDKGRHHFVFTHAGDFTNLTLDAKLLQHILVNLLSNAVKYSPAGSEVHLDLKRCNGQLIVRVFDQGIGIPADGLAQLYDPFYRAQNTGDVRGTGLGMTIVKESVEMHQGTILCESQEGVGTTFTIQLPVFSAS